MDYPALFPLYQSLAGRSAEEVRGIARTNGFTPYAGPANRRGPRIRGYSEIWFRLAGAGYAIIRIDSQGHANLFHPSDGSACEIGGIVAGAHGGIPHFHKEWIAADLFATFLTAYVPQVVRYDDTGYPVFGFMNDGRAKRTHIRQG